MMLMILAAVFLLPSSAADAELRSQPKPSHVAPVLEPLRRLFMEAVEDERAIDRALAELASLRADGALRRRGVKPSTLTAYHGALISLRAKHGAWPPSRLQHLREGLELLDGAVRDDPEDAEARYLRLMTCYYLPGILGRKGSVRDDFSALGTLLPVVAEDYPPNVYRGIASFVLKEGGLPPEAQRALRTTLTSGDG